MIIKPDAITEFRGDYFFLSNFYMCPVLGADDIIYPSSEHSYMSCKNDIREDHLKLASLKTAREARNFGQTIVLRPNWDNLKYGYMKRVLQDKFTRNPHLGKKLLETGDRQLVENGSWHDLYWGICSCEKHQGEGKNALGQILEEIRNELKDKT